MKAHAPDHQALLDMYAKHPLREATILARIARQRGTLEGITELDLAQDSLTEITDQNHVGGVAFVVQLAVQAGIGPASRILDIGAGLGGSARCLAHLFGSRVHGVELSPLRCEEGTRLTERVLLGHLVTCTCGDILSMDLPTGLFDVVWGQGAWMHIADTSTLFERAAGALGPTGRVVFEEACLVRAPRGDREARMVDELARLWGGQFLLREVWQGALAGAALEVAVIEDLTRPFLEHFAHLTTIARTPGAGEYNAHEAQAFELAITLTNAGVIGYFRFVAARH